MNKLDTLPYKTFQRLKAKYPVKTIVFREKDTAFQGLHLMYKDHRDYVRAKFKEIGVEITQFEHYYQTLDGAAPKLGLVFLANDSVLDPGLEVHALIGHNARYINEGN